jgi:hypothetical protein
MSSETSPEETAAAKTATRLAKLRDRRATREAVQKDQADAQLADDLEAIADLEDANPETLFAYTEVPFVCTGLPVRLMVKCAEPAALKRYRAKIKSRADGTIPDWHAAAAELCDVCLLYPSLEVLEQLRQKAPGITTMLGVQAAKLASGAEVEKGNV